MVCFIDFKVKRIVRYFTFYQDQRNDAHVASHEGVFRNVNC